MSLLKRNDVTVFGHAVKALWHMANAHFGINYFKSGKQGHTLTYEEFAYEQMQDALDNINAIFNIADITPID